MSNLAQRTLTALAGVILATGALWYGGWVCGALAAAAGVVAQREFYGLARISGANPVTLLGLGMGALVIVRPLLPQADSLLTLGLVALLISVLFLRRENPILDAATTAFGVLYPAFLFGAIVVLRQAQAPWLVDDDAFWLTATVLFSIWGADTAAYFTGRAIGKRPLLPAVSPKKTWEGAIGGALGAIALTAAFQVIVLADVLSWTDVVVIGICCGIAGPLGDLTESLFKRSVEVKDSATWLPGHGGMLDRIDAALVAVPLVVAYLSLVKGFS